MERKFCTIGLIVCFAVLLFSCNNQTSTNNNSIVVDSTRLAKFEPANGKVILFAGQDLEAIGGTDKYTDGYFDHFPTPGGSTQYTDFLTGHETFGLVHKGLDGLTTLDNWGDGDENISVTTADKDFDNCTLAIGLDISQGHDSTTSVGGHDSLIYRFGNWLKTLGNKPVFLRIGYEFDGEAWNHYKKEFYIPAWKRIRQKLDSMGIENVAYVWQSQGAGASRDVLNAFYPGDDMVDWVAFSYFDAAAEVNHPMIQFARDHKKPLFIAEASPVFPDEKFVGKPLDLTKTEDATKAWKDWFTPLFKMVNDNPDVIKAIHYINCPWKSRKMWKDNGYFKNIDARITKNDSMKVWWLRETSKDKYLKASDTLFSYLWNKKK
jgi:Glycosyl hydrolase family 26